MNWNSLPRGAVLFRKLANKNGVKYSHVWHPSAGCQISVMGYTLKLCAYLETGVNGIQRTSIYYCDPMRSGQKGGLEQAHTMLRMVLPKGTSFEFLTQWDLNLIVSHINSTPRESLEGRTPYSVALETMGEDVLNAFQLRPIAPDEVNLTPKLIRFNH